MNLFWGHFTMVSSSFKVVNNPSGDGISDFATMPCSNVPKQATRWLNARYRKYQMYA